MYFTENLFARAGVDGIYNIDQGDSEWMAGVGVGLNFGGGRQEVAQAEPEPVYEPVVQAEEPIPETVRVELDVKFDFDKDVVREDSYDDIRKDRKSTRLNSSHVKISYAVFCLKKKN